jgi:hypothetical protein
VTLRLDDQEGEVTVHGATEDAHGDAVAGAVDGDWFRPSLPR